jgi:hypothetical protein
MSILSSILLLEGGLLSTTTEYLAFLHGGKTPYILREVAFSHSIPEDIGKIAEYKILGVAYINGLMFSEAITAVAEGTLKDREFVLVYHGLTVLVYAVLVRLH